MEKVNNWMKLGRIRRMELKNLRSLQDLCVASIYKNLPWFCKKKPCGPFSVLPAKTMTKMIDNLNQLGQHSLKYAKDEVQEIFLWENTEKLSLYMERWYQFEVENIFKVIPKIGLNLVYLRLEVIPEQAETMLQSALRQLVKLETLILSHRGDGSCDKLLRVVGSRMPELKNLNIDGGEITDQGIAYLCKATKTLGKCKKLETINFNCDGGEITTQAIVCALENLPELQYWRHAFTYQAVLDYAKKHKSATLPKFRASISVPFYDSEEEEDEEDEDEVCVVNNSTFSTFLGVVPNVSTLSLDSDTIPIDVSADTICKAEKIESLHLKGSFVTQAFIEQIVKKLGDNIDELHLKTDNVIDVSVIGKYCPNLKVLSWQCKSPEKFQFDLENQFKLICNFEIIDANFPGVTLKSFLTSEQTGVAKVRHVNCVDEDFMQDILKLAYKDRKIFSNLEYIMLLSHKVKFETYALLITMAPKLDDHLVGDTAMCGAKSEMLRDFMHSFDPYKNQCPW